MALFLLDCECVWIQNKMYPKEISLLAVNDPINMKHFLIHIPQNIRVGVKDDKRNTFLYRYMHHLHFHRGTKSLIDLASCIPVGSTLYVQGDEKQAYFQQVFPQCRVLCLNAPSLSKLEPAPMHIQCPIGFHSRYHCTTMKIYKMLKYFQNYHNFPIYYGGSN